MEGLIPSDLFLFIGSGKAFYLISLMISPLLKEQTELSSLRQGRASGKQCIGHRETTTLSLAPPSQEVCRYCVGSLVDSLSGLASGSCCSLVHTVTALHCHTHRSSH